MFNSSNGSIADEVISSSTSILLRPAITSHIFKFVTNRFKTAIPLAHVCSDFRDSVLNYSPAMWRNIVETETDKGLYRKCVSGSKNHGTSHVLSFFVVAFVKHSGPTTKLSITTALRDAHLFRNSHLVRVLLDTFAMEQMQTRRLPRGQRTQQQPSLQLEDLLSCVSPATLCSWLLQTTQVLSEFSPQLMASIFIVMNNSNSSNDETATSSSSSALSVPLLRFAARVAALTSFSSTQTAPPSWCAFTAIFLATAPTHDVIVSWLRQFPHRFSVSRPDAVVFFGKLIRVRMQQLRNADFWFNDVAPALIRIVHETRRLNKKTGGTAAADDDADEVQKQHQRQQIITAASNAASLLFAPRICNFPADLTGCILEDCNLAAADLSSVVLSKPLNYGHIKDFVVERNNDDNDSNSNTNSQERPSSNSNSNRQHYCPAILRDCVVWGTIRGDAMPYQSRKVLEQGTRAAEGKLTCRGHRDVVCCVTYSPDGEFLASGSADRTIRMFCARSGTCIMTLAASDPGQQHTAAVRAIAFSPDGSILASGSDDKSIKLWDVASGTCITTITAAHTHPILSVAFSPDGKTLASSSWFNTVHLWDLASAGATTTCTRTLAGHTHAVHRVSFSPVLSSKLLASVSHDTVKVWNFETGKLVMSLHGHMDVVLSVAFSPDGRKIASGGSDRRVKVWCAVTGACLASFAQQHNDCITGVSWFPDGQTIVSSSRDQSMRLWSMTSGLCGGRFSVGRLGQVQGLALAPGGRYIAGATDGWMVVVADPTTALCVASVASGVSINSSPSSPASDESPTGSSCSSKKSILSGDENAEFVRVPVLDKSEVLFNCMISFRSP